LSRLTIKVKKKLPSVKSPNTHTLSCHKNEHNTRTAHRNGGRGSQSIDQLSGPIPYDIAESANDE